MLLEGRGVGCCNRVRSQTKPAGACSGKCQARRSRCTEQRTHGAAQAFAEADRDRVEGAPVIGDSLTGSRQGIEQAGAIKVKTQPVAARHRANRLYIGEIKAAAAAGASGRTRAFF